MENKYQITKRSPNGNVYNVIVNSGKELSDHILACLTYTDEEILSVIRLPVN